MNKQLLKILVTGKCIKVVSSKKELLTIGEAMVKCASEGSRLVQLDSCDSINSLAEVAYKRFLERGTTYFIGIHTFQDPDGAMYRNFDDQTVFDS